MIQNVTDQQKMKNRMAIKTLTAMCIFFTQCHIGHTTNLVNLIESCGSEYLSQSSGRSKDSVLGFVEALGFLIEQSLLKQVHQAHTYFHSILADECTDITTVEELSIFCR